MTINILRNSIFFHRYRLYNAVQNTGVLHIKSDRALRRVKESQIKCYQEKGS